ncbi:MAG: biotin/lipoyl-binding protein [Gammaproteobacteria bacterium]|nr:biotin/lipoyl-binding protein [Gammaproteobacteria bacterium]
MSAENIKNQALEFLPAVLEVPETPPLPIARTIGWAIVAFFIMAVDMGLYRPRQRRRRCAWQARPGGQVKTIQPLESGVVQAIHVEEGDHVTVGELLIELDSTTTGAG